MPVENIINIVAIILIVICIVIICLRKRAKKKAERNTARIEYYGADTGANNEDDATVLMRIDDGEEATALVRDDKDSISAVKVVILQSEDKRDKYEFSCAEVVTIGRKSSCSVQIVGDKSVSGEHCIITCNAHGELTIKDNNSSNGTYLNDEKLVGEKVLESGDTLEIGRTRYSVRIIGE